MKATYILLLIVNLNIACNGQVTDYNTALKSCTPLHVGVTPDGKPDIIMPNTDCIIGAKLPVFSGTTIDGKQIDANYFIGKITVINFWFVGCQGCEKEMPGLNQLAEKYKTAQVNFLAIGRNNPKDIRDFLMRRPFNFVHVANGNSIIEETFKLQWGYPFTIVTDQHAKIIFTSLGMTDEKMQTELVPVIDKALKRI